jgi:hypothetical protein
MKRLILGAIAACAIFPAQAQPLNPVSGALFGGVFGGAIGSSIGRHDTGPGVAIGVASGLLLGSIAEAADRGNYGYSYYGYARPRYYAPFYRTYYSAPTAYYPGTYPQVVSQPQEPPPTTTVYQFNWPTSPMSSANSLFGR